MSENARSELDALVGHWVQIVTAPNSYVFGRPTGIEFGILEGFDEGYCLLRKQDGETLYILADYVRGIIPLEEPPTPATTLLRPAEAPEEPLLRPASNGDPDDQDKLLRPA